MDKADIFLPLNRWAVDNGQGTVDNERQGKREQNCCYAIWDQNLFYRIKQIKQETVTRFVEMIRRKDSG